MGAADSWLSHYPVRGEQPFGSKASERVRRHGSDGGHAFSPQHVFLVYLYLFLLLQPSTYLKYNKSYVALALPIKFQQFFKSGCLFWIKRNAEEKTLAMYSLSICTHKLAWISLRKYSFSTLVCFHLRIFSACHDLFQQVASVSRWGMGLEGSVQFLLMVFVCSVRGILA